ncbi:hypothetical protein BGX34_011372 [Mortierella sp. NVP85]|nr:hypothetical protein BGX34_011372 [Mortierella sp. NVP85]
MTNQSPVPVSDPDNDSDAGNDSDDEGEGKTARRVNSNGFLSKLRKTTSRLSFGDDRRTRASGESERAPRISHDSASPPARRKEILQDLSDEEKQQEPRKSRSSWRPSLSLIRQESNGSKLQYYLQNDPNRIHGSPDNSAENHYHVSSKNNEGRRRRAKGGKASKKKRRRAKKRRAEQQAALKRQQQLYEQQLAEQAWLLPNLTQVLEKKTRYPLSYNDFEAFLRNQRAVEYLNFWTDVTAHEQLCRTFDVSERRQKREHQLEERAIARDKRRMALVNALESGRLTPDADPLVSGGTGIGAGTGIGIGASGQGIDGSGLYVASRSSLQLPLNDHLSFPPVSRRYGTHDSSAAFTTLPHGNGNGNGTYTSGTYTRAMAGASDRMALAEMSRPSLEELHISEQDAAVAAVAMRAQRTGLLLPYSHSRPATEGGLLSPRYQQNNFSNGHFGGSGARSGSSSPSLPNAYNMTMRGRGLSDAMTRPTSRTSRRRPTGTEEYFGTNIRSTSPQTFMQQPSTPQLWIQDEEKRERIDLDAVATQDDRGEAASPRLRHQYSHQSLGISESELSRRPSIDRFEGGVGPLQAPVSIHSPGEGAYASSIFSTGQGGKSIMAHSFRAIGLEDLEESATRIYQKYLIQLRTTSMAEEEAAALATKETITGDDRHNRHSIDKVIAPGWDGYAEEVIATWNAKWQERKLRRSSTRKSVSTQAGDGRHGDPTDTVSGEGALRIDTNGNSTKAGSGEDQSTKKSTGKGSLPNSPKSAKMKRRTGTGLSALLNPILTKFMLADTIVVELPTLTINTTTIEVGPEDSTEDDDDDEEDDGYEEDEDDDNDDSDAENEGEEQIVGNSDDSEKNTNKSAANNGSKERQQNGAVMSQLPTNTQEDTVEILDRSIPFHSLGTVPDNVTDRSKNENDTPPRNSEIADNEPGGRVASTAVAIEESRLSPESSSSSLSSSWDRIAKSDFDNQVEALPFPVTTSKRPSPYRRHAGLHGSLLKTSKTTGTSSTTGRKVGWKISTLLGKAVRGTDSSSSSLGTIQVTPITSPHTELPPFQFQIPVIITEKQEMGLKTTNDQGAQDILNNGSMSVSGTGAPGLQQSSDINAEVGEGSSFLRPRAFLPGTVTNATTASSIMSSPASSMGAPQPSVPNLATVTAPAVAAAFYLPLECRQRIHAQVQRKGRTYTPHLFGPAKGFVADVVLQDHYYPQFVKWVEQQNLGLLTKHHPNNRIKRRGMIWAGILIWLVVIAIQLTLILLGIGGWSSPWVWVTGVLGGWIGSICLATGVKGFSPVLGLLGKVCEDKHLLRFRTVLEPSIRIRHRLRAYWMLTYCILWSSVIMVLFAALPQRTMEH